MITEGHAYLDRLDRPAGLFSVEQALARCRDFPTVTLSAIGDTAEDVSCQLRVESIERFSGPRNEVLLELAAAVGRDETVLLACHNEGERRRLEEMLHAAELDSDFGSRVRLCVGRVSHGFRLADERLVVLSDHELFGRTELRRVTRRRRPQAESRAIDTFLDLRPGDLVVHLSHGIGRFRGMQVLEKEDQAEEHLVIEFADAVRILVPVSLIHLVQKYIGAAKTAPPLSKIGGKTWANRKARVAESVRDMAADMLRLQAARASKPGRACPPDSEWQHEFEDSFPYVETDDQIHAIADVKGDLERTRPMDRLICGDVGFGKTEVAMRAAFKMVDATRQVAVLVPTTVLAEQHYRTFCERMAEFPVTIEVLSRFRTKAEQKRILERMATGAVDVVIGTHRLVQRDVAFKDLGLLIIDEEQRFGVEHKEMLKRMRLEVDVLTLSATPIPRTLHMAVLGIRDISNLTTAPQERVPIETRISRFDERLIRTAIVRELNRGGQVYFVHNRVYNIHQIADRLRRIVPEANIGIGHGQMAEGELEQVMLDFVDRRLDVLVATTIIESGLDIPNANTIFIHQADKYGLADLHQLRGRVGRYKHRAYCYLLLEEGKPVSGIAAKRLKAIEEYSELGAGFRIAMRDLEIRGAGNILGTEQSGHIASVGYELYCQLLENAVRRLKGEPIREHVHVNVNLPVTALLPDDYVPTGRPKIEMYRKLSGVHTRGELEALADEFRDRFGPLPEVAARLLSVRELQLHAAAWGITDIHLEDRFAVFDYASANKIAALRKRIGSDLRIVDSKSAYLVLPDPEAAGDELVTHLIAVLGNSGEREPSAI
jgi:transcription-repair coupling factor (superfamily II helicase)